MSSILGLLAFVAIFAGAAWALRWLQRRTGRQFGREAGAGVRVLTRYPLGWQCMLMVIDVGGKHYAITVSRRGEVTLLGDAPQTAAPAPAPAPNAGFAALLRRAISQHGRQP